MSNGQTLSEGAKLGISTDVADGAVTIAVEGDLDLVSAPELESRVGEVLEAHAPKTLILDAGGLGFLDSTGLRLLWTIRQRAQDASSRLVLRSPSDAVLRLLKLTGMYRVFSIEGDQTLRPRSATAT